MGVASPPLVVKRPEAASLLGQVEAALLLGQTTAADPADMALRLQALGHSCVLITQANADPDFCEDYVLSPQARGWLSSPRWPERPGVSARQVLQDAMAAALAEGFVGIEALILGKMAVNRALRQDSSDSMTTVLATATSAESASATGSDLPQLRPAPRALSAKLAFAPLQEPLMGVYPIVSSADAVEHLLAQGVRTLQLRIKASAAQDTESAESAQSTESPHLRREIERSVKAARAVQAQLFINDHWRLALEAGAYGVHLGQDDLDHADWPALAQAGLRLGLSTHAHWEVCRALALQPSYIACGPIHATQSKDMPWMPQGNDNLAYWCALLRQPVVAIAGMDLARTEEAARCGASGVALISAITQAAKPEQALRQLQQAFARGREQSPWPVPPRAKPTLRPEDARVGD